MQADNPRAVKRGRMPLTVNRRSAVLVNRSSLTVDQGRTIEIMKHKAGLILLNIAATLVMLGGCFDMFLPIVPANLLHYLKLPGHALTPELSSLLLGLFRALGGCLLAIGLACLIIINYPVKRGERWASWAVLLLIGLSEGINASQMWRFGSPYYFPLAFVVLTVIGLLLISNVKPEISASSINDRPSPLLIII